MEAEKSDLRTRLKWLFTIIKNGLFWHGIRNRLAKIGFDFMPYYWETGPLDIDKPEIRDDESHYDVTLLNEDDIIAIKNKVTGIDHKDLIGDYKAGDICMGIKKDGELCIYTFIKNKPFKFRGKTFNLGSTNAYVHHTYTFEAHRGKNLAPYLRYQCYRHLQPKGVTACYSIGEYFNKASLRYKKKLHTRPLKLFLSVILFKKWTYNFTLKSY